MAVPLSLGRDRALAIKAIPLPSMSATGAIAIRPYRLSDVRAVHEAAMESVQRVEPFMPWCHPHLTEPEQRTWIEAQIEAFKTRTAFEFAIIDGTERYLGGCGLNQLDGVNRRANVGYWVRSSAVGKGVATAAIRLLVSWAWAHTDLGRLEVVVASTNLASLRTAHRAGATREGVLRRRLLLHDVMHDAEMLSFVRD
jgi:ribosomal-protein-serine acetyltransferase